MPTVEQNRKVWDLDYDWTHAGTEWSAAWGTARMQWFGSILPRISRFVPASTILEIAPGCGRWTAFLKDLCKQIIIVDLSPRCIENCRKRFAHELNISYFVNDGMSLEKVEDGSVDFIFSFDSLVHAEEDVLRAYMSEFAKKLRPDGAAFIHHSNLGEHARLISLEASLSKIPKLVGGLHRLGICNNHWRARTVTATKMAAFAEGHNLRCVNQELVTWSTGSVLLDCFSTIVPNGSKWSRPNRTLRNHGFMREARQLRNLASLYDRESAVHRQ